MRGGGGLSQLGLILLLGIPLVGCSTLKPYDSGRMGLIDRLSLLDQYQAGSRGVAQKDAQVANVAISEARIKKIQQTVNDWQWPLKSVKVTSHFGHRRGQFHEGIDLRAPTGTPIHAAQDGVVMYSDRRISGYGKMVVIRHSSGLSTVYAHNSKLLVKRGDRVKRGQKIALSGSTGRARGPHLHFEIRDGVAAVNPYQVLPRKGYRPAAQQARSASPNPAADPIPTAPADRHVALQN